MQPIVPFIRLVVESALIFRVLLPIFKIRESKVLVGVSGL